MEDEVIGAYNALPQALWDKYFYEAQGYTVGHTIIYQENKSSILLEVNVKLSSSKYTKHISDVTLK